MKARQGYTLSSLRNVRNFLLDHAETFDYILQKGAYLRLESIIADLAEHATTQVASNLESRGATQIHYALRRVLLEDHMAPIARIARADLTHIPELEPFRMPRHNPIASKLATDALGMANAAGKYAEVFIAAGLPDTFINDLRAAATAMSDAVVERSQARGRRVGATLGLAVKLSEGRHIVAVLHTFVRAKIRHDAALFSEWNSIRRARRVASSAATNTSAATAPASIPSLPSPRLELVLDNRDADEARQAVSG